MIGNRQLLGLTALACGLLIPGCADAPGMAGYTGLVVNASGDPIAGAEVLVLPLPAGGVDALEAMALAGQLPDGWHCKTDAQGRFLLRGMPTGQYHAPRHAGEVDISAQGKSGAHESDVKPPSERVLYQPGMWLGLAVTAPGYQPFVARVTFPVPSGTLTVDGGPIRLVGRDLSGVKVEPSGLRLTLARSEASDERPHGAAGADSDGLAAKPSELQTIEVPLSAVVCVSGGHPATDMTSTSARPGGPASR